MPRVRAATGSATTGRSDTRVAAAVGFLIFVELTSGIIQGMTPALTPRLGTELSISAGDLNLVTGVQLLAAAVSVPLLGRLGDLYGHRRVLRVAVASLAAGSLLVAWSPSVAVLLLGRVLQGPLAALLPLEMGLVRDRLGPQRARRAVGLLVGALTFGSSTGMVLAGLLSRAVPSVHGVLLVPAVATVLCTAVVFLLVPESATRSRGAVDWTGAALLSLGLAALLTGVSQGSKSGWTTPAPTALLLVAVIVLTVWVRVELRAPHPVVDIRTTVRRSLLPVYAAGFLLGVTLYGAQVAAALFLAASPGTEGYGFGYGALGIGWVLFPAGICAFAAATVSPALGRRLGTRAVPALGGCLLAAGYTALVLTHHAVWQFALLNAALGFGTGLVLSTLPALVLDASPADRTGIATGLYSTAKTLGGSIGSAVFAAVLTAMTVRGTTVPTESAYTTVWWLCAAVSLGVTGAIAALPRHDPSPTAASPTGNRPTVPRRPSADVDGTARLSGDS
ncbi:MFS transporter [Kitasatospora sp. NPDC005856]|uniref:MFS transporter n=1 Tax=Kitasatospora sp. NPDC005856 TaxID=3154566 RepID=UPI0033EB16DE